MYVLKTEPTASFWKHCARVFKNWLCTHQTVVIKNSFQSLFKLSAHLVKKSVFRYAVTKKKRKTKRKYKILHWTPRKNSMKYIFFSSKGEMWKAEIQNLIEPSLPFSNWFFFGPLVFYDKNENDLEKTHAVFVYNYTNQNAVSHFILH